MSSQSTELLRRLAISDEDTLSKVLGGAFEPALLDPRAAALVGIAALMAMEAGEPSYGAAIAAAQAAGVEDDEILGVALGIEAAMGAVKSRAAVHLVRGMLGREADGT